jgi:hypothetical protein
VGTVVPVKETNSGIVTTTGVLTISGAKDTDSFDYYCKAVWSGNAQEIKSDPVYLSVLGITSVSSVAWGVFGKSTQFVCKSDAGLKKNKAGDPLVNAMGRQILTDAAVTWEYYDTTSTTWKASTEDSR